MPDYLSTAEVARYLRLNQKKIYALVAAGQLPAARISGKWLFPRELVDRWVAEHTVYPSSGLIGALLEDRLLVLQGSDDWLLSRVIDRFQARFNAPIPTATVGSLAGLSALGDGKAHVASCHVGASVIPERAKTPVYLFGLYAREQGILVDRGRRRGLRDFENLCRSGIRFAQRQEQSGTFHLVERIVAERGLRPKWKTVGPYTSHLELALGIRSGAADAGVGIRVAAHLTGLDFVPLAREEFGLAVPASFVSHPRVREFLEFLFEELRAEARRRHPGYSFEPLGRVHAFGAGEARRARHHDPRQA